MYVINLYMYTTGRMTLENFYVILL